MWRREVSLGTRFLRALKNLIYIEYTHESSPF